LHAGVGLVPERRATGQAVEQGARAGLGEGTPQDAALANGCCVSPATLTGATADMDIRRHEVFGPVPVVFPVDDPTQATAAAGGSVRGDLHPGPVGPARRFTEEAECGQAAVNAPASGRNTHHPSGDPRLRIGVQGTGLTSPPLLHARQDHHDSLLKPEEPPSRAIDRTGTRYG